MGKVLLLIQLAKMQISISIPIALYTPEIGRYMKKMAISDFRFYSRALTSDDVAVLYADEEERNNPDPATHTIVELQRMIDQAISDKARTLTIPAGTYRGKAPLLTIKDAVDLEIIADGVLMVCETQVRALAIENCKNLKLKGLTIDYDPLTFTQGDIINVGSNYVDVKIHKGYPVRPYSRIDIIDSKLIIESEEVSLFGGQLRRNWMVRMM